MSRAYYYEGVDPDALLDTMKSTYGYNRSEDETIRDSEGYSVNSYSEETDELDETQQTEDGYAPNIELHEEAYSQAASDATPSVDERLLTGRYQTNDNNQDPTRRVQEPLPEEPDEINAKDTAALFDWNKKFQDAVESKQGPEKYRNLSSTARDFVFVATTYGRIIISEAPLPIEQKTIKPSSLGGIAGGEKYLVKGILFKFAVDTGKIYGGDENAQKAASSELKGLSSCYMAGVEGLHFPLMALIHYMGYCLIALSTLPLGPNTLKYGSANAGKVVHDDDTHLSALMKTLGGKLNLKGHWAGVPSHSSQKKFLYMPCDIEGHKGNDNKFYMLDFSRVFPPEAILPGSPPQQGALFFRHLRPELVINNDRPLSSDAFCGFGLVDPDRKEHNAEVLACTKRLLEEVIPNFAERIKTFDMNSLPKLKALLHSEGINVRHLGFLRTKIGDHAVSRLVLIEMIARVFKNKLKNKWRKIVGKNLYITEDKCINAATDMLNLLICSSVDPEKRKKYEIYWNNKLKFLLKQKFRFALSEDESKEDFDLLSLISSKSQFDMLLKRVLEITGITLTPSANANWTSNHRPHEFQFLNCDISMLDPIVKHTPIIEQADISILFTRGLEAGGQEAQRLLSVAIAKITQNYGTFLFPHEQLRTFGNLIAAKCNGAAPADLSYLRDFGSTCFTTALQLKPNSIPIIRDFAQFLTITHEISRACEQLIKASNLDPFDYTIKNQIMRLEVNAVVFNRTDDLLNSTAKLAKDSLALNPKQGEPYFWWAYAILRKHSAWKNPVQYTGSEVLKNGWNEEVVEDVADKIKSGLDLEPSKLDILSRLFPSPRAAILYTLVKVPELAAKIDKDVKHLTVPTFVQNDFLEQLPVFTHLETITIEAPEALDSGVIRLIQGSSKTLTKVVLSNTKITALTLQELAKCPSLEWLSLDNCQFTENPFQDLLALLKATQVTQLFVKNVPHLTEQQIGELIAVHPMTRLGFRKTDPLTVGLFEVLQQAPNLATSLIRLDIENFDKLTVDHVLTLLKTFQSLKALSILDCAGIEVALAPHTMSFNHPALEELIMPLGYPLLFTGSHNNSVKFSTVVANAHQISATNNTPLNCVDPEHIYQEYNSTNWVFKRSTMGMRVLELQHNNQTVIWVEKIPPGDRFRVLMMGKNGNPLLGDVSSMSNGPLMVNISSLKINLHLNAATSFFVPLSPNMQLVFSPQDARINLLKGGMNVIFHIIAAFLVGSKIKRML